MSEQRFWLGIETRQLWIEYDLHIPSNFTHRDKPPPLTDNNKFLSVWRNPYTGGPDGMCWRGIFEYAVNSSSPGDSLARMIASGYAAPNPVVTYDLTEPFVSASSSGQLSPLIGDGGALLRGAWNTIRAEFVMSSSAGASDGRMRLWVNGTFVCGTTSGFFWDNVMADKEVTPGTFINRGYFLGFANSGFDAQTDFHLTAFKFYNTDPGWNHG